MNIKILVNDIWEVGDCWTSDDTYDFATEIVDSLLKQMKINLNFIESSQQLSDNCFEFLINSINDKISQTLESSLEEWGDPWSNENSKYRKKLVLMGKKRLSKVVRTQIVFATKYLKQRLEQIKDLVEANKRREKIGKRIDILFNSIRVKGPKRKRVQVDVKTLEVVLCTLRNYLRTEEKAEQDKLKEDKNENGNKRQISRY
jgi:hypothetical protein